MPIVGGGIIVEYKFSQAWGVNPSAASGKILLDVVGGGSSSFDLSVGDYVVYGFDAIASTYGVVTEIRAVQDFSSGATHEFVLMDNRIRLGWQTVFGAWNIEDRVPAKRLARPDSPPPGSDSSGHGSDNVNVNSGLESALDPPASPDLESPGEAAATRRRYKHLLPENWSSGLWTYTDQPFTAREILNSAFNGAWGDYGFTRSYHSALSDIRPTGIDHSGGVKLSSLVSEITQKAGLDLRISGSRNLIWGRKGVGLLPLPDATSDNRSQGESMTAVDTKLRVVGDATRVQAINIALEPDWKPGWEAWLDEVSWTREIAAAFDLPADTKADRADIAAKAREITVAQFAARKEDPGLEDHRPFGANISRMNMPAWHYIQELVFRSYRVPVDFKLYGVPLSSLQMADQLLCATEITGEGSAAKQRYRRGQVEFYPPERAQVIHQGQPLDLINAHDIRAFYKQSTRDLRQEWTVASDFEVDAENFSIRFRSPVFIEGAGENALFLKVNKGEGGGTDISGEVDADSDYLDVVVPNPGFTVAPANVKASFCFLFGRFFRDHGSGPRRGVLSMPGLGLHVLDTSDDSFAADGLAAVPGNALGVPSPPSAAREILYQSGDSALDIADAAATAALQESTLQASGGFTRHGVVGTQLTPVIDRVDVEITFGGAVTETITYTKARPSAPLAERTLDRIQRVGELFPGQEELRREIREYRLIAALERGAPVGSRGKNMREAFDRPVGATGATPGILVYDKNSQSPERDEIAGWRAGDLVWLDDAGLPSRTGKTFGGVVVFTPAMTGEEGSEVQDKWLTLCQQGSVPVYVTPGVQAGGFAMAEPGDWKAAATGSRVIGMLEHATAVPGEGDATHAMVRLGVASPSAEEPLYSDIAVIPESDPVAYGARVAPGYVRYQNAGASEAEEGVVGVIVPKIRKVAQWIPIDAGLEDDPPGPAPLVPLPAPASWVYVRVKTDADGVPKFGEGDPPATVEAFDAPQKSIHHVRPSPSGGEEEGDYYFLILQTVPDENDPEKPVVKKRVTGNLFIPNQLVEIENLGDEEKVRQWYEGYAHGPDDKHRFRSAEQIMPASEGDDSGFEAVPIIKPLDPGKEGEPPVVDESGTIVKPGTPPVPPEKEGDTIKWKFLAPRITRPQIKVKDTPGGNGVIVEGNGVNIELASVMRFAVSVEDGMIVSLTPLESDGGNLNVRLMDVTATGITGFYATHIGTLYFRGGVYVGEVDPDNGNPPANLTIRDVVSSIQFLA